MKKYRYGLIMLSIAFMLGACGQNKKVNDKTIIDEAFSDVPYDDVTGTQDAEYKAPVSKPGVIIDLYGYKPDEDKIVIFEGEGLSDYFDVINADNEELVYEGRIESTKSEQIFKGDFSEVTEEGTYYIVTDVVGRSYNFKIDDGIYDELWKNVCDDIKNCRSSNQYENTDFDIEGGFITNNKYDINVEYASASVITLLMTYESKKDKFENRGKIPEIILLAKEEVEWLMKMQDESGGVSRGVFVDDSYDGSEKISSQYVEPMEIDANSTASFVAALSYFSGIYKEYDSDFADLCLYKALVAYEFLEKNKDYAPSDEYAYMENAEMYRTTGLENYGEECIKYRSGEFGQLEEDIEGICPVFIGDMAYLSTEKIADVQLCSQIMESYMEYARTISNQSSDAEFYINKHLLDGKNENKMLLYDMKVMTFINCIITNKEYRTVIQNHMHYMYGENEDSLILKDNQIFSGDDYLYNRTEMLYILTNIENKYDVSKETN